MTTTELLIAVPLLRRPHRVQPLLESIRNGTPEDHRVLLLCSKGDQAVIEACRAAAEERANVEVDVLPARNSGDYAFKINAAYRQSNEPFILTAADDLNFHPGWWPAARRYFDDPRICVVGTNDLAPTERSRNGEHSTHCVIRSAYATVLGLIDGKPGVLFDGYEHEFVDDELVGTAKFRGAWAYAADSVVEHLHPHWGKGKPDAMYRQSNRRMIRSRPLFNQRKRMWT